MKMDIIILSYIIVLPILDWQSSILDSAFAHSKISTVQTDT